MDCGITPETLRHSYARARIKTGTLQGLVRRLLGHTTSEMARVYADIQNKQRIEAAAKPRLRYASELDKGENAEFRANVSDVKIEGRVIDRDP